VEQIKLLSENKDYLILLKFHPLMDESWIQIYKDLAHEIPNIIFETEKNIIKFLLISDVLISDTSSVIYEFLLLDKPVITFNNISDNILWQNSSNYTELIPLVEKNLNEDPYSKERKFIFENYHPYNDGKSAKRMVDAVADYIKKNGVPEKRKLSILRRFKINSIFKK
jgi:CDP-glycerol glycerophosphotransferase (TagB/SpsB family)